MKEPGKQCDILPKYPRGPLSSDLAVQDHHMLGIRSQPRLHGLTYGTDLIQWWGVEVRPAKVVNLVVEIQGERLCGLRRFKQRV